MRRALMLLILPSAAYAAEPSNPEGFPRGEAGPPTRAATGPANVGPLTIGSELFANYTRRTSGDAVGTGDDRFELSRLHLASRYERGRVTARVVIEGTRSTADGALVGVAGDSFVLRAREAYAEVRMPYEFGVRAGMVPTLTIPEIEGTWLLRAVAAVPLEQLRFASPADLGAQARWTFPQRFGALAASVTNGEGYTSRELDTRKSGEIALTLRPLAGAGWTELALFASASRGTIGVSSARNDRATAALLWQGAWLRTGLSYTLAWGLAGDGALRPNLFEAFVSAEPVPDVLVGLRATRAELDSRTQTPTVEAVLASAGYRVAPELEAHIAAEFGRADEAARLAQPGADRTEFRAVIRANF